MSPNAFYLKVVFAAVLAGQGLVANAQDSLPLLETRQWDALPYQGIHIFQAHAFPEMDFGVLPKVEPARLRSFNAGGYYRYFMDYRYLPTGYEAVTGYPLPKRDIFIGDDSQLPQFMLNISGKAGKGATWGMDLFGFQFLEGNIRPVYSLPVTDTLLGHYDKPLEQPRIGGQMNMLLGMNLYSTVVTPWGGMGVRLGGIHWYELTELTMGAYIGYNRYMLFDRNPWDPIGLSPFERYNNYVSQGQVSQEQRWGKRAFQGGIVELLGLPGEQQVKLLLGKNEQNGGFDLRPNGAFGGQYIKSLGEHWQLSAQTMNQQAYQDSMLRQPFGSFMHTGKVDYQGDKWKTYAEAGWSGYSSVDLGRLQGFAGQTRAVYQLNPVLELQAHGYAISPKAINNAGAIVNASISEAGINSIPAGQAGSSGVLQPTGASLLGFGQLANNRFGLDLNASYHPKNLYLNVGYSASREWQGGTQTLAFGHPVNALTRSRFWRWQFPAGVGPYARTNVIFRNTYDKINLAVVQEMPLHFAQWEAQSLYRVQTGNKVWIFNHLLRAHSIDDQWSILNVAAGALFRQYSIENEAYLSWNQHITLVGMASADASLGNLQTMVNSDGRPINQRGWAYGFGADIWATKDVSFYLRHKWFGFTDQSFLLDTYQGTETTLELKLLF